MNIFLVCPHQVELGIRSIGAYLRSKGFTQKIGFFDTSNMLYSKKELNRIIETIISHDSDVVMISSLQISRLRAFQLSDALKRLNLVTVCGGIDATLAYKDYLDHCDYVIRGEGEEAAVDFLQNMRFETRLREIDNLAYSEEGRVMINELKPLNQDLDTLPFEDYENYQDYYYLKNSRILNHKNITEMVDHPLLHTQKRPVFMMTSRGCPNSCSYCINASFRALYPGCRYIRKRSIISVVEKLKQLKEKEDFEKIFFYDDDFFIRTLDEIKEFSHLMKEQRKPSFP